MNGIIVIFVTMLVISIVAALKSSTARDRLGLGALGAFFALMSGIALPEVRNLLAEIAKIAPSGAGEGILILLGFISVGMILMIMLYSEVSTEEEVKALFSKASHLNRWFPPHKHKIKVHQI